MKKIIYVGLIITTLLACGDSDSSPMANNESSKNNNEVIDDNEDQTAPANLNAFEENLTAFQSCKTNAQSKAECKYYISKAICEYYGIDDLKKEEAFVDYDKIPTVISSNSNWYKIGDFNEENIQKGLEVVNNKPVLVFNNNNSYVHVVAILPNGSQSKSLKWGNITVPDCVSYFPTRPNKSFTNKGINYAFSNADDLEIWTKK